MLQGTQSPDNVKEGGGSQIIQPPNFQNFLTFMKYRVGTFRLGGGGGVDVKCAYAVHRISFIVMYMFLCCKLNHLQNYF